MILLALSLVLALVETIIQVVAVMIVQEKAQAKVVVVIIVSGARMVTVVLAVGREPPLINVIARDNFVKITSNSRNTIPIDYIPLNYHSQKFNTL